MVTILRFVFRGLAPWLYASNHGFHYCFKCLEHLAKTAADSGKAQVQQRHACMQGETKEREQDFAETTGGCRRDEEPSILWRICALRIFIRFELALDRRQLP